MGENVTVYSIYCKFPNQQLKSFVPCSLCFQNVDRHSVPSMLPTVFSRCRHVGNNLNISQEYSRPRELVMNTNIKGLHCTELSMRNVHNVVCI